MQAVTITWHGSDKEIAMESESESESERRHTHAHTRARANLESHLLLELLIVFDGVVAHPDPTQLSLLVQLLQHFVRLRVCVCVCGGWDVCVLGAKRNRTRTVR